MARALLIFTLCSISLSALAESLFYAGFSYLGDLGGIETEFPYSSRLNEVSKGISSFDYALAQKLKLRPKAQGRLILTDLADIKDETALSVTLALESELTSIEIIEDKYKVLLQVSAQLMVFDYSQMQVVATYPIDVQFIDIVSKMPDREYLINLYERFYFSDSSVNIFDIFLDKLETLKLKKKYSNHLRVVSTSIDDSVKTIIPNDVQHEHIRQMIGQNFTRFLSANQGASVLPYKKGHAVGNKLAGRFSNGDIYMMDIPEPDYSIEITLTGLKKKKYSESPAGTAWIYATQLNFKFYEELSGEVIFEDKLYSASTKTVPVSQATMDDWAAYNETLLVLFDKFTKALTKPKKTWLKKHAGDSTQYTSFKNLIKVIATCR